MPKPEPNVVALRVEIAKLTGIIGLIRSAIGSPIEEKLEGLPWRCARLKLERDMAAAKLKAVEEAVSTSKTWRG